MSVHFQDFYEIVDFIKKAGYTVTPPKKDYHYEIISGYTKNLVIGCTSSREDVLMEEQDATFKKVAKKKCSVCNENR